MKSLRTRPLASLFLVVFTAMTGFGIVVPTLPFFGLNLHASAAAITWAFAAYSLGQMLAAPLWGRLSDVAGRRRVLIATLLAQAILYLVLARCETMEAITWTRFIAGLAAGNVGAAFAAASDVSTRETRARAMGVIGAGFGLGFIVGPAIGGVVAGRDPGQADFARVCYVAATLAFAASAAAFVFMPETRKVAAAGPKPAARLRGRTMLVRLLTVSFLAILAQAVLETSLGLWSKTQLGWTPARVGLTFGMVGLIAAGLQGGAAGRLAKRLGERAVLRSGLLAYLLGFSLLALAAHDLIAYAAAVLVAIGAGLSTPSLQAMVSLEASDDERGAVMGWQQAAGGLARVAGPLSAGPAFDHIGPNSPFALSALACVGALLIVLSLGRWPEPARAL